MDLKRVTTSAVHTMPFRRFEGLLAYMEELGVERKQLLTSVAVSEKDYHQFRRLSQVPMLLYCQLYRAAVRRMEFFGRRVTWAGGVASKAFDMMCHCLISCRTLGDALRRAETFIDLLAERADRIEFSVEGEQVVLKYHLFASQEHYRFVPANAPNPDYYRMLAVVSGMMVWYNLCGWLIGRTVELDRIELACPYSGEAVHQSLRKRFHHCSVEYNAGVSTLYFSARFLEYRLVHSVDSLERFLKTAPYELMLVSQLGENTSSAIRSLIGDDFSRGCPSFEQVAERLNMSPSSLRRRLLKENSSYQQIKDEVRRDAAIEYLRNPDLTIKDIAELMGFMEPGSFSRAFRQWVGMTPQHYRDEYLPLSHEELVSSA